VKKKPREPRELVPRPFPPPRIGGLIARATVVLFAAAVLVPGVTSAGEAAGSTRAAVQPTGVDGAALAPWGASRGLLIEGATVVTMDARHDVLPAASVLVHGGRIVAVWSGPKPPTGVVVGNASVVRAGPFDLLFPGLINLHDHPSFDVLPVWLPPASDAQPAVGKAGTDPYANRYQWGADGSATASPEEERMIANPENVLTSPPGLGLSAEVDKYAEAGALLGGETTLQNSAGELVHGVEQNGLTTRIAPAYVGPISSLDGAALSTLQTGMAQGAYDAWIVHLAEGVRDRDRRPGDPVSSRAEFAALEAKGLLTDETVIIHGTALERSDFAAMRAAPSPRDDGTGDGLGAKLVWSPLSNLLLYGKTTNVYDALAEGVLVSLGTDWTPSGSRTLLHELKVADDALRDPRLLGGSRDEVPAYALAGKGPAQRLLAEAALDRALVDMVTRNPAMTLRWYDQVGSIEAGKIADLLLIHAPATLPPAGVPPTPYRALIDASERDVELVLVGGEPRAGDVGLISALKPGDYETVTSPAGGFQKAIDASTTRPVPAASETIAQITTTLQTALTALGGDNPAAGGGPGPANDTYSYLRTHVDGGALAGLPDPVFNGLLASQVGTLPDGSLNLEPIRLNPLFDEDDELLTDALHDNVDLGTGLLADPNPPYKLYPANLNQIGPLGDPLSNVP
jgi:cytosine/adenosine deaminase-related metal-dependent hydrolase